MAFTRHALRLHQRESSRQLRSRQVAVAHISKPCRPKRISVSCQSHSSVSKHANSDEQHSYSKQLKILAGSHCDDSPRQLRRQLCEEAGMNHPVSVADDDRLDTGVPGSDPGQSVTGTLTLSSTIRPSVVVADTNSENSAHRSGSNQDERFPAQKNFPTSLEDVGLPPNQLWDHNAAYDRRFCFDHGETEYLLGTANRWMSSGDFDIPNAAALLEAGLQRHKDALLDFQPHLRRFQADCYGSLWSHVHSVVERYEYNGASLYLVQWKVWWTPESNIDDKAWVTASLKANQNQHSRRSVRLEDNFEDRKNGYDKMMVVVNLE